MEKEIKELLEITIKLSKNQEEILEQLKKMNATQIATINLLECLTRDYANSVSSLGQGSVNEIYSRLKECSQTSIDQKDGNLKVVD